MYESTDFAGPQIDPQELKVNDVDVSNAIFIVPSDVPIPGELANVTVTSGSLYRRLAPLDSEPDNFCFVPLSGPELLALDRVWHSLVTPKRVYALMGLPGARYDVVFTQAARQIGIRDLDWLNVAEALGERSRHIQRTRDTAGWQIKEERGPTRSLRDSTDSLDTNPLRRPSEEDDSADQT